MEDGMHVLLLVQTVEHGTRDVRYAFGNNPDKGCCRHAVDEWLEGNQHAETHANEAERLDIGMFRQLHEADDGACYGTQPYKREERPAPIALGK